MNASLPKQPPVDLTNLIDILRVRFEENPARHNGISWDHVAKRLNEEPQALKSLLAMELTGGEPDVISSSAAANQLMFCDCSAESPLGRRNVCYDDEALAARKQHKPAASAVGQCEHMGVKLLTEDLYRHLQTLGEFDLKTSSWIQTPESVRSRGGALFCDRRFDMVFVYHNGADSYYGARGFRAYLEV